MSDENYLVNVNNDKLVNESNELLFDIKNRDEVRKELSLPISELTSLGSVVASVAPIFESFSKLNASSGELYRVSNKVAGDALKMAKDGNFWGALKTADGKSKMAKLSKVDPSTVTNFDPAVLMMAVALYSIEKEIGNIAKTTEKINSFLINDKEAHIEGDLETLVEMISKFKFNWDNKKIVDSNYKLTRDIKRSARKNISSYNKNITDHISSSNFALPQSKVVEDLQSLITEFKYYRLSLYSFSLSSLAETLFSGDYKEETISISIDDIRKYTDEYRELFTQGSFYIEKISKKSIRGNLIKGVGIASDKVGKLIGSIPKVKDGQVDEFLQEKGVKLKQDVKDREMELIYQFSEVSDPNTKVFLDKLSDVSYIYNNAKEICCDKDNIYLVS